MFLLDFTVFYHDFTLSFGHPGGHQLLLQVPGQELGQELRHMLDAGPAHRVQQQADGLYRCVDIQLSL